MKNEFMPKGTKGFKKGHIVSPEVRKKISENNKKRIVSKETKLKMSKAHKGKKLPPLSLEQKLAISKRQLGKKQSIETIKKRVESRKGYKHSEETKRKIGKSNKKENCPTSNKNEYEKKRHRKKLEKIAGRKKTEICEICDNKGKICFDHNHNTGKFRGWICSNCNMALGLIKDDINILNNMIKYLKC